MTPDQTKGLLEQLHSLYSNLFQPDDTQISYWIKAMSEVDVRTARQFVEDHVKSDRGAYPPNLVDLIRANNVSSGTKEINGQECRHVVGSGWVPLPGARELPASTERFDASQMLADARSKITKRVGDVE